jgi:hypothetical protein
VLPTLKNSFVLMKTANWSNRKHLAMLSQLWLFEQHRHFMEAL